MHAAYYDTPGPSEVIRHGELPTPVPKSGEIRVRVRAASVNPIDTYIRSGMVAMAMPRPTIPGCDFAGEVDEVGPDVVRFKAGDRVWGSNQGLLGRQGTFAEYCCVAEQWAYPSPQGVSDEQLAAGALVGITAHLGLFHCAKLVSTDTVFVNGGTGGVGSMVIQMAKAIGATVITTVGSEDKAKLARDLGADVTINYKTGDLKSLVKTATNGRGITLWYETQPPTDFDSTFELMAPRGRVVVMAGRAARPAFPNGPFYVKALSLHGFAMFNNTPEEQRICADAMNTWYSAGQLKVLIGRLFPLNEAAAAHLLQEENTLNKAGTLSGKIVVLPPK